jgi:hypothetical protein
LLGELLQVLVGGYEGQGCVWFLWGRLLVIEEDEARESGKGVRTATFRPLRSARIWAICSLGGGFEFAIVMLLSFVLEMSRAW